MATGEGRLLAPKGMANGLNKVWTEDDLTKVWKKNGLTSASTKLWKKDGLGKKKVDCDTFLVAVSDHINEFFESSDSEDLAKELACGSKEKREKMTDITKDMRHFIKQEYGPYAKCVEDAFAGSIAALEEDPYEKDRLARSMSSESSCQKEIEEEFLVMGIEKGRGRGLLDQHGRELVLFISAFV
eukprot:CAMPEP_0113598288 /NCGR_PEP_ID=MMETSP0015_2-20120614/41492_1 /TAXON_ID=2838 /ORGANISM="Odontella" /LENGTH=184 /DNA_ID=CAMNT_0000506265 /DNA_START=90 /DNA_END=641 /DNA_ORIENTATION=+ /assembly_acc=CAM_ASM_000160